MSGMLMLDKMQIKTTMNVMTIVTFMRPSAELT